jgi:hypothetical protein
VFRSGSVEFDVTGENAAPALSVPPDEDVIERRRTLEIVFATQSGIVDLSRYLEKTKKSVLERVVDAADAFSLDVVVHEPDRLILAWHVAGHCLLEDQISVTSFASGPNGVTAITFAARGEGSVTELETGIRLVRDLPQGWWPTDGIQRGAKPPRLIDTSDWGNIRAKLRLLPRSVGGLHMGRVVIADPCRSRRSLKCRARSVSE